MSNPHKPEAATPAKSKTPVGIELTVEGTYWGFGKGGQNMPRPYEVKMLVPVNYNEGGRGNTYVKKALLGKISGTPFLRAYKDDKGELAYGDYRQLRTHNITDWQDVFDAKRASEMVKEKTPEEMSADELKHAITKLGITYPNPARKSELVAILLKAQAKKPAPSTEEDDGRPNFQPGAAKDIDRDIDDVDVGTMVDTSDKDPNNPLLPPEGDKFIDTFTQ